jgi:hypothetical protein
MRGWLRQAGSPPCPAARRARGGLLPGQDHGAGGGHRGKVGGPQSAGHGHPSQLVFAAVKDAFPSARYYQPARIIAVETDEGSPAPGEDEPYVLVVSEGTSDIPVAEEATVTEELLGSRVERLYDVGVAGLHRLLDHRQVLAGAGESGDVLWHRRSQSGQAEREGGNRLARVRGLPPPGLGEWRASEGSLRGGGGCSQRTDESTP